MGDGNDTATPAYAERLERVGGFAWKRALNVQAPYRWHIRRLNLGRTVDVGCGIGRNLSVLDAGSIGIDHNEQCVVRARASGLVAYTPGELLFRCAPVFDSMLVSHVLEHLGWDAANGLVRSYLPLVKPGGNVVLITPQQAGFASDATHVRFVGFPDLRAHAHALGLALGRLYSFPFPTWVGHFFPYNEFVAICRKRR